MIERILTVLISVPIIFACTYFGGLSFLFLLMVLAIVSLNEFYNLMKVKGFNPYYTIGNFFTLLLILVAYLKLEQISWEQNFVMILTSAVIISFCAGLFIKRSAQATANIALTILGVVYIGMLYSYLILLRGLTKYGRYVFMLMFILWVSDILAYFVGKTIGRRQLSPYISPKKTVEGAIAGLIGSILTSVGLWFFFEKGINVYMLYHYLFIGFFLGVIGQVSDLSESLIKRDVGVKDSSNIVPGHGGVLDRMDSFIFSAPALYYYLKFFFIR